jgi:PKD repeat protein
MNRRLLAAVLCGFVAVGLTGCIAAGPEARFVASPREGWAPLDVHFDGRGSQSSPNGTIVDYDWDLDGEAASGAEVDHTFTVKGPHPVELTVTDSAGQTARTAQTITVKSLPPVASFRCLTVPLKAERDCEFDASESSDPDGEIVSYVWSFGDGETDEGESVTHVFALRGEYTVRLTVTDDSGVTDSVTTTFTVAPNCCG